MPERDRSVQVLTEVGFNSATELVCRVTLG